MNKPFHFHNFIFFGLCALFLMPVRASAQKKFTVQFNESGQITSELPSLVRTGDRFEFIVVGTKETYELRVSQAYNRYLETIKNLDKQTDGVYAILLQAGLADNMTAVNYLHGVQAKMAHSLLAFLANRSPNDNRAILEKTRNIADDITKLTTYTILANLPDLTTIVIPDIDQMIIPVYTVEYQYDGGLAAKDIPCKDPIMLTTTTGSCKWIFSSTQELELKEAFTMSFKLNFQLRQSNIFYGLLTDQLKTAAIPNAFVRGLDADQLKKELTTELKNRHRAAGSVNDWLMLWMESKYKGKADETNKAAITAAFNGATADAVIQDLTSLNDQLYQSTYDKPESIHSLLELSWLTQGNYLTANPLITGIPTDFKGMIEIKTKELADSAYSLTEVNQKIVMVENVSKGGVQGAQQSDYLTNLIKSYSKFVSLQKTILKKQADLNKELADLKEKQTKMDKSQQDNKKSILADSLLYSGYFRISLKDNGDWINPNHLGFHYMRNHNALNDYAHFDQELKKEVNEEQYLEAIAINQDPKVKVLVKFSFVTAPKDVDFIGTQFSAGGLGALPVPSTIEDIYKAYVKLNNKLLPYQNGVVGLPLIQVHDASADYISKTNVTPDPDQIPAKGPYSFVDSLTGKNLNTQGASFSFRVNKLYRFRFKAGLAYSSLSRRAYAINTTTNTATYTTNYVGMGPCFGVQIFTSRLDIQKTRFLPASYYPFLYVGYLYNDAPVNNFLLGWGFELFSGMSVIGGLHLGKTQRLITENGNLATKDYYKTGGFVSISFGLEAFTALFNSAKSLANPITK